MGYFLFLLLDVFFLFFVAFFFLRLAISAFLPRRICLHLNRNNHERAVGANMRVIYKRRVAHSNGKNGYWR